MASVYTKQLLLDPAMLKQAWDEKQAYTDKMNQYRLGMGQALGEGFSSLGKNIGEAADISIAKSEREEQVKDFMEKYKDDPMAKAAAYNFISGKDPNAIQKFIDDKTKRDELEANKQKTIEGLKGQIATNLRRVETADSRAEAKKHLYEAQNIADTLANQYGIQVDVPNTDILQGDKYDWQQKEAEEKTKAAEKAAEEEFSEQWEEAGKIGEAREKAYQEELKQQKEDVEYEIKEFDKQVEVARKIKNPQTRKNVLYELAEDRKILMDKSKKYKTSIPTMINADEYTVVAKRVADENTFVSGNDKANYTLPKGYHWSQTRSGLWKIEEDK